MAKEKEAELKETVEKQDVLVLNGCTEFQGDGCISQNAIARIVTKAALAIEGVARFAPKGAGDILNFFTGKAYDSSLVIEFIEGKINLNLALNLYFGCLVPSVVKQVRAAVAEQVTALTGAEIGKINILVKDLVDPEPVAEEVPAEEAEEK